MIKVKTKTNEDECPLPPLDHLDDVQRKQVKGDKDKGNKEIEKKYLAKLPNWKKWPEDLEKLKPFAPLCRKPLRRRELASHVQKREYDENVKKFDADVKAVLQDICQCFVHFKQDIAHTIVELIHVQQKIDGLGRHPKNLSMEGIQRIGRWCKKLLSAPRSFVKKDVSDLIKPIHKAVKMNFFSGPLASQSPAELEDKMEKEDQALVKCFDDVLYKVGEDQEDIQKVAACENKVVEKAQLKMQTTDLDPEEAETYRLLELMKILFPSIQAPWLRKCIEARQKDHWKVDKIASWIFDNLNVAPREEKNAEQTRLLAADMETQRARILSSVRKVDNSYMFNAKMKLCEKFNRISAESIDVVLIHCHHMYLPALIFLAENLSNYLEKNDLSWNDLYDGDVIYVQKVMTDAVTRQLKKISIPIKICDKERYFQISKLHIHKFPDILRLEVNWGERYLIALETKYNARLKERIKAKRRERRMRYAMEHKDTLECDLCMESYLPEEKVTCSSGHIVCSSCLRNHANEVVNGNIVLTPDGDLPCLIGKCDGVYRDNMLTNNIPDEIHDQIDDRRQHELLYSVLKGVPHVYKCPFCQFVVFDETDPKNQKVLQCQHPKCKRRSCRLCKADWRDHDGRPCTDIETNQEEALRKRYEAVLSMRKIRICHRCGTPIVKNEGCNKMTCRCGAKMCYLCRAKDIDYEHFCRHPTTPGKACEECKGCRLFEDAERFDKKVEEDVDRQRQMDEWKLMLGVQLGDQGFLEKPKETKKEKKEKK